MTEPYLILHKVRGQPAFDIAEQMEVGDEVWWIVSTSGHRAYPYWTEQLSNTVKMPTDTSWIDDWPDHYQINYQELTVKPEARHRTILQRLGLAKPKGELRRI